MAVFFMMMCLFTFELLGIINILPGYGMWIEDTYSTYQMIVTSVSTRCEGEHGTVFRSATDGAGDKRDRDSQGRIISGDLRECPLIDMGDNTICKTLKDWQKTSQKAEKSMSTMVDEHHGQ